VKCPIHGCVYEVIGLGDHQKVLCPECADERMKGLSDKKKEIQTQNMQSLIDKAIDNSMLSPRFRTKNLDNYEASTKGQISAIQAARWFLENWKEITGLLIIGNPGTGKNHIDAGIVNEFLKIPGRTALVTEAMKVIRSIKETWRKKDGPTETEVIKSYLLPDLLVIDEIGVQFESDTEKLYLTEIINDRYNWLKPTIISGNVTIPDLERIIGERVIDRFREGGRVIVCDWKSYRKAR
jgi:DNA replication protein DnaC